MIQSTTKPQAKRSTHLTLQQVGSETLVYDESRHLAFCLNATAATVWQLADGTRTIEEIAAAATLALAAPCSAEMVQVSVEELDRHSLLASSNAAIPFEGAGDASRRALLKQMMAGAIAVSPLVVAIAAPPAAQAYNGCVNCNGNGRISSSSQRGRSTNSSAGNQSSEGSTGYTSYRQQRGRSEQ